MPVSHTLALAARTLNQKFLAPCTDRKQFEEIPQMIASFDGADCK